MFPKETKTLVVDDMMTMRKIVRKSLGALGITDITEADDGSTAWVEVEKAIAAKTPFQLIVSDWNMPTMKGIDFLRKVRSTEIIKTTPFVLLTAEAEKTQVMEAVQAGVSNYIVKPFTPQQFSEKLEAVWQRVSKK